MTKPRGGFREHTSEELSWIEEQNFINVCVYHYEELRRINGGESPTIPERFLTPRECLKLRNMGIMTYHGSGNIIKDNYKISARAQAILGSLELTCPPPTPP